MIKHFFIAGAQRSGTTYLYRLLAQHPEIEMAEPVRPEPKFFLSEDLCAQGQAFYEQGWFGRKPGAWLRGEKSTSYIESPLAAQRIAAWYPDADLVFVLRDPIERAVSNYWFSVNNGLERLGLADAFLHEAERRDRYDAAQLSTSPFAYLRRGCYSDFLETYGRYFPPRQMHILLYEQLVGNLAAVQQVYGALGAATNWRPAGVAEVVNESRKGNATLPAMLKVGLQEYFAEPNARLAARFNLDLACWKSCYA